MKVLLINGSSHKNGSTFTALSTVALALREEQIETEIYWLGTKAYSDCIGCEQCRKTKSCIIQDGIQEIIQKADESDGFVFGTSVYYSHPTARVLSVLDRLFYSGGSHFAFKPGAAIASCRRTGTIASIDVLNKYFTINQMPIVSSTYWNEIHGNNAHEAVQDLEGIQTMYNLGKNMAWLLKCIEIGKKNGVCPPSNSKCYTNFIRKNK